MCIDSIPKFSLNSTLKTIIDRASVNLEYTGKSDSVIHKITSFE